MNGDILMRVLVMFDLPVSTSEERSEASKFRTHLLKLGFLMIQFSIYSRIIKGVESSKGLCAKIKTALPKHGSVRVLEITDRQYENMHILIGPPKKRSETLDLGRSLFDF
ncbi:CRISPR-associated endonuclease Cas2 [Helicobacter sp. 11S02629-2]|uniref:CRISPR-associated endonuclease Cas2 n=1 Tax=Helicobacter sp. 11S02629-2 TaxID=1476195 RepID=UPI000BA56D8D|nr:CRISPR-associated endonuclease Cas2 [Helicobacter sp. 11S02629-2]PAF41740.1 CRISPR-associated endonuclease Cas2 [Helicobacter sp. 11S02629-2]